METTSYPVLPTQCPACEGKLVVTRLQCPACGTEVAGAFPLSRLASLREPHASLLELFLRLRGNMKELERALGLSYPTVRARLEEALTAAGLDRTAPSSASEDGAEASPATAAPDDGAAARAEILDALERGEIGAADAVRRLRERHKGGST